MSRSLGGGALNDLGIYASTSGYLFWEEKLKNIKISEYKKNNLNMGFTVLANYGNGKDFIGNFGFDKVYMNNVKYFEEILIQNIKEFLALILTIKLSLKKKQTGIKRFTILVLMTLLKNI